MTETENRRNHECNYNKYYTMPSREELHRGYGGWLNDADFIMSRGNNQKQSRIAEKIARKIAESVQNLSAQLKRKKM
mgnify:CR=1 FL=1